MLSRISSSFLKAFIPIKRINPISSFRMIQATPRYFFTSSSDPTQTAILQEVEAKVYQVLKSAAKCDQSKLSKSATFEQLGFDSLDSVELVVAMQEYFGFDIPNEQAQKISTVSAAVNTFYRHMNAKIANKIVESDESNSQSK